MATLKCITDPLGHTIFISSLNGKCESPEILITDPTFIIKLGYEELYYFRLIDWEVNMLVASKSKHQWFMAETCMQQPTADSISLLLRKGGKVISFL